MALTPGEYQQLDATGLAALIRRGDASADEVLETCVGLIEARNPALNAVIHKCYDLARAQLPRLSPQAPFAGVPLLLKDLGHHLAGTPHTRGNAALRKLLPLSERNSYFVDKLAAGGFVFPGKTNVPEFGLLGTTEPEAFGAAHNPWNLRHTPGGSSGGSGAMVAAGVVPLATANDGGGSIRIPASYCGLVGLKPGRGVISNGPHYADLWDGLNADLVLSRSVRDTVAVLGLTAGPMPGDACAAPVPGDIDMQRPPAPLRIALNTTPPLNVPVSPGAESAARSLAALLSDMGHTVEEAAPDVSGDDVFEAFSVIYMSAAAADYREVEALTGRAAARRGVEGDTRFLAYLGDSVSGARYAAAKRSANGINRAMADFFQRYDLYLTPTTAGSAPQLGENALPASLALLSQAARALRLGGWMLRTGLARGGFESAAAPVPYTQLANISGLPSISLPGYIEPDSGLPVGAQLTAPQGGEGLLLRLAGQVEEARPWLHQYPFNNNNSEG